MCDWVTLLYSRKLTEHCKPTIMEKIKIQKKKKKDGHKLVMGAAWLQAHAGNHAAVYTSSETLGLGAT